MDYTKDDYMKAIKFCLNYPSDVELRKYDMYKDIYKVTVFDDGWYDFNLQGSFVRNALKYKGKKVWIQ